MVDWNVVITVADEALVEPLILFEGFEAVQPN
jgi:hypothetical protein